jgi:hypothetical protein
MYSKPLAPTYLVYLYSIWDNETKENIGRAYSTRAYAEKMRDELIGNDESKANRYEVYEHTDYRNN